MTRPLRGQREVYRRLNENQEARRERINRIRARGGLEPIQQAQPTAWHVDLGYMDTFVGRPNNNQTITHVTEIFRQAIQQQARNMYRYQADLFMNANVTDYYLAGGRNRYKAMDHDYHLEEYSPDNFAAKVQWYEFLGKKPERNEDYMFLMNKGEGF